MLAPDFAGFGGTPAEPGMTVDIMANALPRYLESNGVAGPVVVGGCSMGGYVALAFARLHPSRVCGLILADTKAEADDETAKANRNQLLAKLTSGELDAAGLIESMLPKMLSDTTRNSKPDVVAEVRRIGSAQSIEGIQAAVRALRDRPDAVPGLSGIAVPTLVLVGEQDSITPPAVAEALANRIAGSERVILPGAGHLANLESAEKFNAAVKDFLTKHFHA